MVAGKQPAGPGSSRTVSGPRNRDLPSRNANSISLNSFEVLYMTGPFIFLRYLCASPSHFFSPYRTEKYSVGPFTYANVLMSWIAPICYTAHGPAFVVVKRFREFLLTEIHPQPLLLGTATNFVWGVIVVYTVHVLFCTKSRNTCLKVLQKAIKEKL